MPPKRKAAGAANPAKKAAAPPAHVAEAARQPPAAKQPVFAPGSSYFLSGVMQGRKADGDGVEGTVPQDYRAQVAAAVLAADSSAVVIEPWELVAKLCEGMYPPGTSQSEMFKEDAHVRLAFSACVEAAANADVVISYLPEASMGSAVEIYAAREAGRTVLAIAPGSMAGNWVVRSYADELFASIDELSVWLGSHVTHAS